jgi:hypothetical protein
VVGFAYLKVVFYYLPYQILFLKMVNKEITQNSLKMTNNINFDC